MRLAVPVKSIYTYASYSLFCAFQPNSVPQYWLRFLNIIRDGIALRSHDVMVQLFLCPRYRYLREILDNLSETVYVQCTMELTGHTHVK